MAVSDFLPRHLKGYAWICFLVAVFLLMAMSENGAFEEDLVPSLVPMLEDSEVLPPNDWTVVPPSTTEKVLKKVSEVEREEKKDVLESKASSVKWDAQEKLVPESESSTPRKDDEEKTPSGSKVHSGSEEKQKVLAGSNAVSQLENTHESESTYTFSGGLDPKDVVIVVKTGASSIWRRMPMFMSTTLGNAKLTPNILYYSDSPDNINGHPVVDVLANVSATLKATPDFTLYHKAKELSSDNLYLESGSMEGDSYLPGGWRLDKYKFLPMFQHVAATMPGKKWYIYMEDDNYFFWPTLYAWLSTMDHKAPTVIGSPAYRLGEDFAHGGSGFAISGKALEATFGADKQLAERWEDYAQDQCCGDQVLSHVMRTKGVQRDTSLDGSGWKPLQALPTWRIGFGLWNWCSPIMNIHKVHQADISRLHVFEKEFMAKTKGMGRMRYKDIFIGLAKSQMKVATKSEWDNYAAVKSFSSSQDGVEALAKLTPEQLTVKPWFSKTACLKACEEWKECMTWRYADDSCFLDHTAALGQRIDAGIRMESGWMLDRIATLEKVECDKLDF